jgi:hypothetical protein
MVTIIAVSPNTVRRLTKQQKSRRPDVLHLDEQAQVYLDIFVPHGEESREDSEED